MADPAISLRPALPNDAAFLYALYCDTRAEELGAWGWGDAERSAFLQLQYRAQQAHFRTYDPAVEDNIVDRGGQAVGRLMLWRASGQIYVVDVALMREYCSIGIGSLLIRRLQAEATQCDLPLRLQVMAASRAVRFYERLRFSVTEARGTHLLMEWLPGAHRAPLSEQ